MVQLKMGILRHPMFIICQVYKEDSALYEKFRKCYFSITLYLGLNFSNMDYL